MKKFFSSMFNTSPQVRNISKDKEEDDLADRLVNETYLSNEFRFQHQNEKYQLRATPNEKVTLGGLLNRTFDIRQEEVSDLYIVTDNICEKKEGLLLIEVKSGTLTYVMQSLSNMRMEILAIDLVKMLSCLFPIERGMSNRKIMINPLAERMTISLYI